MTEKLTRNWAGGVEIPALSGHLAGVELYGGTDLEKVGFCFCKGGDSQRKLKLLGRGAATMPEVDGR